MAVTRTDTDLTNTPSPSNPQHPITPSQINKEPARDLVRNINM